MKTSMPDLLVKTFSNREYQRILELILYNFTTKSEKIIQTSHNYFSLNKGVRKYLDIYNQILKF